MGKKVSQIVFQFLCRETCAEKELGEKGRLPKGYGLEAGVVVGRRKGKSASRAF